MRVNEAAGGATPIRTATVGFDDPRAEDQQTEVGRLAAQFYAGLQDELHEFTLPLETLLSAIDCIEFELQDGRPVAMGGLIHGYREIVYTVAQCAQGQGLGQKMLRDMIGVARVKGRSYLRGTIYRTNSVSLHLCCDRIGYRRLGVVRVDGREAEFVVLPLRASGHLYIAYARLIPIWGRIRARLLKGLRTGSF